jgi:hypothetical protein
MHASSPLGTSRLACMFSPFLLPLSSPRSHPKTYAIAGCMFCTGMYVGLLYLWRGMPRNHPKTIKRRMLSVGGACAVAWVPLAFALPKASEVLAWLYAHPCSFYPQICRLSRQTDIKGGALSCMRLRASSLHLSASPPARMCRYCRLSASLPEEAFPPQ